MYEKTIEILIKIGFAAAMLAIGYIVILIILYFLKRTLKHTGPDESLHGFIVNMVRIALLVVLAMMILSFLNIPTGPLITVLGAAGVAVALAMKDSLGNFAGGILILFTKPYSKDDYIEDLEIAGLVEKIDLLYTTLKTLDNKNIIIPNGKLANSTVINYSKEPMRRLDRRYNIASGEDVGKAMEILWNVSEMTEGVLKEPRPLIGIYSWENGLIALDMKVWVKTENFIDMGYILHEQVKMAFDVADIKIPAPQMDIRMKKS
ncbi:MAG: mechanosensitive ion channel family protein [Anaerovoracaceae bacterium]|jgi:small conductance mechanosensitive channel